ncbi:MAG: DegT/DnrJ/EryC1/StrS family aminotransferase [Phycisphaeraceae bacterium]
MYRIGQEEVDAIQRVIESGKLFRYHEGGECHRFEQRWAKYLGVKHARLTASGTHALTAAMMGLGIGPGDEVLVPANTYMATAVAVLAAGAIPVVVDINETNTIDPQAIDDAVGPRTRAVIPVHMWGLSCDMDAIMRIAEKHKLIVIEDACQAVGGAFEGRMCGSFGHAGAFSFNYFKNMSAGEGGAVVTNDDDVAQRAACGIDCCGFYWNGQPEDFAGFTSNSARASEFEGAIMNVQLDRLPDMIDTMRRHKQRIVTETESVAPAAPCNSLAHECGTNNLFLLPTPEQAATFAEQAGGGVMINTGRHVYTAWDPILNHRGAHHDALNPFKLPQNQGCRMDYSEDMCARSLDIMRRTVKIANHPDNSDEKVAEMIEKIKTAAQQLSSPAAK